jgi:hypothetical protein
VTLKEVYKGLMYRTIKISFLNNIYMQDVRRFDTFPIQNDLKQGDASLPLLFNFSLEYAIRKVQGNQRGLKLNGTHLLPACAVDVNLLDKIINTIRKNKEALLVRQLVQKQMQRGLNV